MELDDVVKQFLLDCEVRGLTDQAIGFYRRRLALFVSKLEQEFQVTELEQVKIVHLRQFVQLLMKTKVDENNPRKPVQDKPLSAFTIRGYVRCIKRLFSWCIDEDLLNGNPATRLVQQKAPDYLIPTFTPEHIEKMLATCDG
jgi:integrase/recombinase XerD